MRIIVNEERGLSQRSRINVICVFCVNPRSGICLLTKELISCLQQQRHLLQHRVLKRTVSIILTDLKQRITVLHG